MGSYGVGLRLLLPLLLLLLPAMAVGEVSEESAEDDRRETSVSELH